MCGCFGATGSLRWRRIAAPLGHPALGEVDGVAHLDPVDNPAGDPAVVRTGALAGGVADRAVGAAGAIGGEPLAGGVVDGPDVPGQGQGSQDVPGRRQPLASAFVPLPAGVGGGNLSRDSGIPGFLVGGDDRSPVRTPGGVRGRRW